MSTALPLASSAPTAPRHGVRRLGAVLAGLVAIFAVTTAIDLVLHATGVYPPPGRVMSHALYMLALGYRLPINVAGCVLTARLAPDRPMRHALQLGLIGLALSIIGAVAMWDVGPAWYPIAVAASALPCAWAGGRLAARN